MSRNHPPLPCNPYYEGVPDYMTEVYDWAYVNPRRAALLDRNLVVSTLLFLNDQRLMRRYLQQIRPGMRVWQVAHVYGDLVQKAAAKVRKHGEFILTDITPVQVEHGCASWPATRRHV
jgi:predicted regulator of amino acid metabolism with ACT domain